MAKNKPSSNGDRSPRWFTQLTSWLSLSALVISASTFFLTYAYKGHLTVILPDRVGIAGQPLAVAMPLVFTATGAARTHRHVVEAAADLTFMPPGEAQARQLPLRWAYELQFVSDLEFRRIYDKELTAQADDVPGNEANGRPDDHIVYLNRAFAFHLAGGTSLAKVYRFEPGDRSLGVAKIGPLEIVVRIRTEDDSMSFSARYRCPGALNENYSWCVRL